MIEAKTAVRIALAMLSVSLVGFALAAGTPPNLGGTLAAQFDLVAERPEDAGAHNDLGNLLVLDGRYREAEGAYARAIELAPENTLPRYNLGMLLQQIGRSRDAVREFRRLLEIDDRHARTHYQLGILYESRKQRSAALESYARAFALDPELTFPGSNPHIIDNRLATEAMLMSERFSDSPSAAMPRLYGEPERIAELMLKGLVEDAAPAAVERGSGEGESLGGSGSSVEIGSPPAARGSDAEALTADDEEDDSDDQGRRDEGDGADRDDEDDEDTGRRQLTGADLEAGSTVGQARGARPAGVGVAGSRSAPSSRQRVIRRQPEPEDASGRPAAAGAEASPRPRYRPASRFSTGRLELRLLPEEPVERMASLAPALRR